MVKMAAAAMVAATFYAGQAEIMQQAFDALAGVQAQQATAVAEIRQVQQRAVAVAPQNP